MRLDVKKNEIIKIFLAQVIASIFTGSVAIGVYHWRLNQRLDKIEYDYSTFTKTQEAYDTRLKKAEQATQDGDKALAVLVNEVRHISEENDRLLRMMENLQRDLTGRVTR